MTRGRLDKKQRLGDERRKRAQAAATLATGAKKSPKAIPVPTRPRRPSSAARGG
jgi:hypothetical protein